MSLLARYVGLSSSGVTYKSGAASFSSSSYNNSDRYGGFGNKRDNESFNESYKEEEYGEDKYGKTTKSKNESSCYGRFVTSIAVQFHSYFSVIFMNFNILTMSQFIFRATY